MTTDIASVSLPDGERIPKLGQGTWEMGEQPARRAAEIAALRCGIELGMTLIDTAEMYGDGATESLARRSAGRAARQVFLVSKVYPHNASRRGVIAACEQSLKRLKTDRLDLYLLHWRGSVPLAETVAGVRGIAQRGQDPALGRQQLRYRRYGRTRRHAGRRRVRDQSDSLQRRAPRTGIRSVAVARRAQHAGDGVQPGRSRAPAEALAARRYRRRTRRLGVSGGARVGAAEARRVRDSESGPRRACARQPSRVATATRARDELAAIDTYFKPPRSKRPLEML